MISDKINLIGFDSDDKTVKLLADGTIQALVVQDPFRMGYEGSDFVSKTKIAIKINLYKQLIRMRLR